MKRTECGACQGAGIITRLSMRCGEEKPNECIEQRKEERCEACNGSGSLLQDR